ncbi:MAG: hypothetical protein Q9211_003335 [Gyalolechia sp. 1 TL-2023]
MSRRTANKARYSPPENICVFSLVVYAPYCQYRIHWRRVDDDGTISYQGDVISRAFFDDLGAIFKVRSIMLETLEWARGHRLNAIKKALEVVGCQNAGQQASPATTITAPTNNLQVTKPQSPARKHPSQAYYPQVLMPHTPPHTSLRTPPSRGSRREPRKRRMFEDKYSGSDDPLQ